MKVIVSFFSLFLFNAIEFSTFAALCELCQYDVETTLTCEVGHSLCRDCLEGLLGVTVVTQNSAPELQLNGIQCCHTQRVPIDPLNPNGRANEIRCEHHHSLDHVRGLIDHGAYADFEQRLRIAMTEGGGGAAAGSMTPLSDKEVHAFGDRILDAFAKTCPNCKTPCGLDAGCNALRCHRDEGGCGATFCNLCMKPSEDSHDCAMKHSGDYWERRCRVTGKIPEAGQDYRQFEEYEVSRTDPATGDVFKERRRQNLTYQQRYDWVLARKKLELVFHPKLEKNRPKWARAWETLTSVFRRKYKAIATRAIHSPRIEAALKQNKMWPFPANKNTQEWVQEVRAAPLSQEDKIILFQDEIIALSQLSQEVPGKKNRARLAHRAEEVKAAFKGFNYGAPILPSLDVRRGTRIQSPNIIPVFEGEVDWDRVPEGMRAMGPENIYRIHDPEADPAKRVPDFILSHHSPMLLLGQDAIAYCAERGARLPTEEEYEALARAMGKGQPGGYQVHLIPNMLEWSCSSSVDSDSRYIIFMGDDGRVYPNLFSRIAGCHARCMVTVPRGE